MLGKKRSSQLHNWTIGTKEFVVDLVSFTKHSRGTPWRLWEVGTGMDDGRNIGYFQQLTEYPGDQTAGQGRKQPLVDRLRTSQANER